MRSGQPASVRSHGKRGTLWVAFAVALCVLASSCSGASAPPGGGEAPERTTTRGFEQYSAKLFTVAYPSEWKLRRGKSMLVDNALFEVVAQRNVHNLPPMLRVYRKPRAVGGFEAQLDMMRGFANMKQQRKVLRDKKFSVPGAQKARLIEDTMPQHVVHGTPQAVAPSEDTPGDVVVPVHRVMLVALAPDRRVAAFMFMVPEKLWKEFQPRVRQMVDSVAIRAKKQDR